MKSAVESEFGDFEDGPAKVQEDGEDSSRGSRRGSEEETRRVPIILFCRIAFIFKNAVRSFGLRTRTRCSITASRV